MLKRIVFSALLAVAFVSGVQASATGIPKAPTFPGASASDDTGVDEAKDLSAADQASPNAPKKGKLATWLEKRKDSKAAANAAKEKAKAAKTKKPEREKQEGRAARFVRKIEETTGRRDKTLNPNDVPGTFIAKQIKAKLEKLPPEGCKGFNPIPGAPSCGNIDTFAACSFATAMQENKGTTKVRDLEEVDPRCFTKAKNTIGQENAKTINSHLLKMAKDVKLELQKMANDIDQKFKPVVKTK